MAIIRTTDGKELNLPPARANKVWEVLTGQLEGTAEQQKFALKVKKIYLNWRNPETPDSYIEANKDIIFPMVVQQWMVRAIRHTDGHRTLSQPVEPLYPEPTDRDNWRFSKKWGLLKDGQATPLARRYFNS